MSNISQVDNTTIKLILQFFQQTVGWINHKLDRLVDISLQYLLEQGKSLVLKKN